MNQGWTCPQCGQVWAPHIDRCANHQNQMDPWTVPLVPGPYIPPGPYIVPDPYPLPPMVPWPPIEQWQGTAPHPNIVPYVVITTSDNSGGKIH